MRSRRIVGCMVLATLCLSSNSASADSQLERHINAVGTAWEQLHPLHMTWFEVHLGPEDHGVRRLERCELWESDSASKCVRWVASAKVQDLPPIVNPLDRAWLARAAHAFEGVKPKIHTFDGIRHTFYRPSKRGYSAFVKAKPEDEMFTASAHAGTFRYASAPLKAMLRGDIWQARQISVPWAADVIALTLESNTILLAFSDEHLGVPRSLIALDGEPSELVEMAREVRSEQELLQRPETYHSARVLDWLPRMEGMPSHPRTVALKFSHVDIDVLCMIENLERHEGAVPLDGAPPELAGERIWKTDLITKETFVQEEDGTTTVVPPPTVVQPAADFEPDPPSSPAPAVNPWLFIGVLLVIAALVMRGFLRKRGADRG